MKYVLIISGDQRSVNQISQRVGELKEEASVEVFTSLKDFDEFLSPKEEISLVEQTAPVELSDKKKQNLYLQALIKEKGLHLIIIDQELLGKEKPPEYIKVLNEKLSKTDFHRPEIQTRYFILSFETNSLAIEAMTHPLIDDLILKPIDNQLFLQKLAMTLSDKRSSAGEFLYKQEVDSQIYMAKSAVIEQLSDLGFVLRSRKSIKDGIIIRVFSKIFGEKTDSSLLGRTYKTIPHPTLPGEFQVFYNYYGINSRQLLKIRKTLQGIQKKSSRKVLSAVETQIFKKNRKKVAVIAFNIQMRADIENGLDSNFINMTTVGFPSLISFAKKMGVHHSKVVNNPNAPGVQAAAAIPAPTTNVAPAPNPEPPKSQTGSAVAFASDQFIFTINHSDEVISVQTRKTLFFDLTEFQMVANSKKWLQFIHPEDSEELQEFLSYLKSNEKAHIFVRLRSPLSIHYIRIDAEAVEGKSTPQITIQMSELKGEEGMRQWLKARPESDTQPDDRELDAILIDASGIIEEVDEWALRVNAFLENTKILKEGKKIAVIALLPEKSILKLELFKKTFFTDVILTPVDRKLLIDKINFHIPGLHTSQGVLGISFDPISGDFKVAQEVKMEMASEYGIQIVSSKPLREGIFVRFFTPLFLDENYDGILARSFSNKVDDKIKTEFHNVFSFYGISDSFLKHIRKWIRETHIAQKDPKD